MPSSVGAAVFESLIGAAFLEGGLDSARAFILQELRQMVHVSEESGHHQNFKSVLQQHAQLRRRWQGRTGQVATVEPGCK